MSEDPNEELLASIPEERLQAMVAAFYRRIPTDNILGPMYPADELVEAEQRLFDFLAFRFGHSDRYVEARGHPRLRMRHVRFPIDQAARDRWMELMRAAMDEALPEGESREALGEFLGQVATFLLNRPS